MEVIGLELDVRNMIKVGICMCVYMCTKYVNVCFDLVLRLWNVITLLK